MNLGGIRHLFGAEGITKSMKQVLMKKIVVIGEIQIC